MNSKERIPVHIGPCAYNDYDVCIYCDDDAEPPHIPNNPEEAAEMSLDPIAILKGQQGSMNQKDYAKALGISAQYLCDIYRGRREPGVTVLAALGLERVVSYRARRNDQ